MGDVLFLAHRIPYPPDRGDKIRSFHLLKHIAAHRRAHLIAFADDARDLAHEHALAPFTATRTVILRSKSRARAAVEALARGEPVSITAFRDARTRNAIEQTMTTNDIETIFVFSGQMAQYLPSDTAAQIVMDFVDMDSAKFASFAADAIGPRRFMMAREGRLLGDFEREIASRADASLFVSTAEADLFRSAGGEGRVVAVENGIDTGFFDPDATFERCPVAAPTIAFTGQMDYRPNMDAVAWFAGDVLPLIRAQVPAARFAIVGRAPGAQVRALAALPGVTVTGEVADVRGWLAAASVVVAPLKLARGVQNKVLEAMAMAQPVVASAAAAEGIDHGGTVTVAGDARSFSEACLSFLHDPDHARVMGTRGRARMIARYGWDARLAPLDTLMGFEGTARRQDAA